MTEQPRKTSIKATTPNLTGIKVTWNPTPPPGRVAYRVLQQIDCTDCDAVWYRIHEADKYGAIRFEPDTERRCGTCAQAAAYRNLPWWRRALTRKPRP